MKKKVEIGINVLFWIALILVAATLFYVAQNQVYPDPASPYRKTFVQLLWGFVSNFYNNGLLGSILGFYLFYAWVVPDYIRKKRIGRLLLTVPLGLIVSSFAVTFHTLLPLLIEWGFYAPLFPELIVKGSVYALIVAVLGTLLKTTILWVNSMNRKKSFANREYPAGGMETGS